MQCHGARRDAVRCGAVRRCAMRRGAMTYSAHRTYSVVRSSAVPYSVVRCDAVQCRTMRCSAVQGSRLTSHRHHRLGRHRPQSVGGHAPVQTGVLCGSNVSHRDSRGQPGSAEVGQSAITATSSYLDSLDQCSDIRFNFNIQIQQSPLTNHCSDQRQIVITKK